MPVHTVPLILSRTPVERGLFNRAKPAQANVAVVYDTGFGETASYGRALTYSELRRTKFRDRYEVDLGDHRRKARFVSSPLPSAGDTYFFDAIVDVGFRVTNAEAVVRRNVSDALVVVYGHLGEVFRPITRRHDIEDAADAEAEINLAFSRPHVLDEGITIYRCVVSLTPDAAARAYRQKLVDGGRRLDTGAAEQRIRLAEARGRAEVEALEQQARISREDQEHRVLASRDIDVRELITLHLSKHPEESEAALKMLMSYEAARQEQSNLETERQKELFEYMTARGLIQASDIEVLRAQAVGRLERLGTPVQPALPRDDGWDEDLPPATRVIRSTAEPSGAGHALPVYLVVDESVRESGYLSALDDGIRTLMRRLAGSHAVAGTLRLAILGYASDVAVRMPMTTVSEDVFEPRFVPGGPAQLGRLFEYLLGRIPRDVDPLKSADLLVNRPTVHLLTAAPVADGAAWRDAHRRLTDRGAFRYAPTIVACAAGGADRSVAASAAYSPDHCFAAPRHLPLADAVDRYLEFVGDAITELAVTHLGGRPDTRITRPAGFGPIGETSGESDG